MDPVIGGALIQAGSGILGSLFGKKGLSPSQVIESNAIGYRHFGEMYGFNPLTLMGANMVQPGQAPPNYLGEAITDAGMMLADAYAKRTDAQKVSRLEERNRKLQEKVQSLTLRPKVGGVYAQRERTPTTAQALGVSEDVRDKGGSGDPVLGDVPQPDAYLDRGSGLFLGGDYYEAPPGWSNGQAIENEFGEGPFSWPAQAAYGTAWVKHNAPQMAYNLGFGSLVGPSRDDQPYIERDRVRKELTGKKPKPKPKRRDGTPAKTMADWLRYQSVRGI